MLYVFYFNIMIAKGRSNIEADIDFMYESYESLIERIEMSYKKDIQDIKDIIQSVKEDITIDYEEKQSILRPYFDALDTLNQQNIKSKNALFCTIYSFWEISLYELCKYYKVEFYKKNGNINYAPRITDYLHELLNEEAIACIPKILLNELDELRNYFIHGTLSPQRKNIIKNISKEEFICIQEINGDFILKSFTELRNTLKIIYKTLKTILSYKKIS